MPANTNKNNAKQQATNLNFPTRIQPQPDLIEIKAEQRASEFVSKQIQRMDGCPVCHGNKWGVSASTYTMSETNPKGLTGNVLPVVSATCKTCGYMLFFNAVVAGTTEDWHFDEKSSNA